MTDIQYIIMDGYTGTEVAARVNKAIEKGFIPIGGIGVCQTHASGQWFYQAMVKMEPPDINSIMEEIRKSGGKKDE